MGEAVMLLIGHQSDMRFRGCKF